MMRSGLRVAGTKPAGGSGDGPKVGDAVLKVVGTGPNAGGAGPKVELRVRFKGRWVPLVNTPTSKVNYPPPKIPKVLTKKGAQNREGSPKSKLGFWVPPTNPWEG